MEITKASGQREEYSREKFCNSLLRSGLPYDLAEKICQRVEGRLPQNPTTLQLHEIATQELLRESPVVSVRYNLKKAIMELGPEGFLFERYVAGLLREYGYQTQVDQILQGVCVSHEIDVVAQKENRHFFIEAKYHNSRGVKSDVVVAMYSWARFLDIKEASEKKEKSQALHEAWIITNTKFTSKAIAFAECRGVKMTGWHYPSGESLETLIEQKSLYPITILPSLLGFAKARFAQAGILFAKEICALNPEKIAWQFGIPSGVAQKIFKEAELLNARVG